MMTPAKPFEREWQELVDARNHLREIRNGHLRSDEMKVECASKLRRVAQALSPLDQCMEIHTGDSAVFYCVREAGHLGGHRDIYGQWGLSMRERQMQAYEKVRAEWQRRYDAWKENGEVGPPPPHPVRPHTPGFRP